VDAASLSGRSTRCANCSGSLEGQPTGGGLAASGCRARQKELGVLYWRVAPIRAAVVRVCARACVKPSFGPLDGTRWMG